MRYLTALLLFLLGSSPAKATLEDEYIAICTYQSAISTHITHELLKGIAYETAVRSSFALFENGSTPVALDALDEALGVHFTKEQRESFGSTMGLAGIVWATGYKAGHVSGSYDKLYERSYITCMEGVEQIGPYLYFDAYYMSLMYQLNGDTKSKTITISY